MKPTREEIIQEVGGNAFGLTNYITEINKEYDLDMWDEIIEYFIEKRSCDENYNGNK